MGFPGKKLLLTGSGQCNFTHSGDIEYFIDKYGKNGRFLRPAFLNFFNKELSHFFKNNGIDYFIREDGKYFPKSLCSREILDLLKTKILKNGHKIYTNNRVININKKNNTFLVSTKENVFKARKLLLTTGGASFPKTGSTGDGHVLAESFGHNIIPLRPALSPLIIKDHSCELAGISLRKIKATIIRNKKRIASSKGDLLFTHIGLSGPAILSISKKALKDDTISISEISNISGKELKDKLRNLIMNNKKNKIKNILRSFDIPKRILILILKESGIDPDKVSSEIKKSDIESLYDNIKEITFKIKRVCGFDTSMCTAGGISLKEIDPYTMESKLVKGLYFAGEVLDIDGETGGYNLQAAFSTARLAIDNI